MPLVYSSGLTYLSLIGKPTDAELERYPDMHQTGPHEWGPSVMVTEFHPRYVYE